MMFIRLNLLKRLCTGHFMNILLFIYYKIYCLFVLLKPLAQLVGYQIDVREVRGSSPGRTNTQGLKITEEKVLPLL